MERIVLTQGHEVLTSEDVTRMGTYARQSLDHIVGDAITDGQAYVGFSVAESGPAEVKVNVGRYYEGGKVFVYDDEGGLTIDLAQHLAATEGRRKIVTVYTFGTPMDTQGESRGFLLDVATRTIEPRLMATVNLRRAEIGKIAGAEHVDPQPPSLASNQIGIANITLDTVGIVSIQQLTANKLLSIKAMGERLVLVEKRLDQAGSAIDTIRTDISGLSARIDTKAPYGFARDLSLDFARTKRLLELPDDYTAWSADGFATEDQSDKDFAGYNATVKDGLRFGETSALAALALLNPLDPRITVVDNMVMPYNVPRTRLAVTGKDGEVALANYNVSSTVMKKLTRTRTEWEFDDFRWADEFQPAIWGGDWVVTRTPTHFGWDIIDARRKNPQTGVEELWTFNWATVGQDSGKSYTRDYWRHATLKSIDEPYFDQITTTETVEGYQLGQTFLNAQQGALRSLDLFFTRKPATGDVKVFLVELNDAGQPNENRVIYKVEKTPAQVSADLSGQTPTNFDFAGAAMVKGRRYAWHIVSQGSYFLATVAGNKYAQGQLFQKNNGVWQAAASDIDLAFAMYFQGYEATRVEVQLEPAELTGGIARLTINCDTYIPEGTSIEWQGFIGGVWKSLGDVNAELAALATRPSLIQLRAILIGTTDSMPAFGIGNTRSCLTTARNGTTLKHISKVRTLPAPCDTVEIILRARHWDDDDHTLTCKVLTGVSYGTVETADSTIELQVPLAPEKLKAKKLIFNLAGSVSAYRIQIEGATSDVTNAFIVNERQDVAFAA